MSNWQRLVPTQAFLGGYRRATILAGNTVLISTDRATDLFREEPAAIPVGPMIQPRSLPSLITLADGRVLAAGGYHRVGATTPILASCELFDPASSTWRPAPSLGTPRYGATLLRVGERVLALGGSDEMSVTRALDSVEAWMPGDEEWVTLAKMPAASAAPPAVVLANGSVLLVAGGAWIWDPSTEAWSESRGGPARTDVALAARAAGGAIAIGGKTAVRDVVNVDVLGADGTWTEGPPLPESRAGSTAIELGDGRVVVVGGDGTRYSTPNTDMLYDWEADSRRASSEWEDRWTSLDDAQVLGVDGTWKYARLEKISSPALCRLDGDRVVVTGLSVSGIWTP